MIKRLIIVAALMLLALVLTASSYSTVVINEVYYDPPGTDVGCFIELVGTPGLSLDDYFLVGVNGDGGEPYCQISLTGCTIPPNGYFVIGQDENIPNVNIVDTKANLQNGPDNIELWHDKDRIDSLGYGDFSEAVFTGEGAPTFDLSGYSIGRRPDGMDSNNNSVDFVGLPLASPGEPNGPGEEVLSIGKLISLWGKIKSQG